MAWYSDWSARCDRIIQFGLPVLVRDINIDHATGFIAVRFVANEADLPRSHADRGFELHLTVGFSSDYADGVAEHSVRILKERWLGRIIRLKVAWFGSGGSAQLAADDHLASDDHIRWLHQRGYYGNGVECLPRDLHVSL